MTKTNLWIMSEERPKREVIANILYKFSSDNEISCFIDTIRILPKLNEERRFSFLYEVVGFHSNKIDRIFLKIVSGYSSFVDYLIFYQDSQPTENDKPLYAIEETKTDDSESRNTGVFQRASKFVYVDYYYQNIKKIMLYNLRVEQKVTPTRTNIFGTRCLLTLGVEILGKKLDPNIFVPFNSIDELIDFKNSMRKAPTGNVPILIKRESEVLKVSGRLYKSGGLAHDPNIGAIALICATLRKLGWKNEIVITSHGLSQKHLRSHNKFVKLANWLSIKLEGLRIPFAAIDKKYWKYEDQGEKLGTIFIHLVVENFTNGKSIFENHAGSEKGYFITKEGTPIPLKKFEDRIAYKGGDKSKIINIPDLILIDFCRSEIINIEGKKYEFRKKAIQELVLFKAIEDVYVMRYYPEYKIVRTIVLYGGNDKVVYEIEVGFLLNRSGELVLGIKAPELFKEAIKNLIDYWFT